MFEYEVYVDDLIESIGRIEKSVKGISFNVFRKDLNLIDATGMRCQIIGESVKKLPKKLLKKYPNAKWKYLKEIRNTISHDYFAFNTEVMWDFIKTEVPNLKKVVNKIKKELK